MRAMDRGVVKASPQRQPIAERAQAAERAGARKLEADVGVGGESQRARAGADGVEVAAGEGQCFPGPCRSAGRSCPMQRW
jgi:hypothetical protein